MSPKRLILPNDASGFIYEEMMERLNRGIDVTIAFGGNSMQPLIDGRCDRIELAPFDGNLHQGDIYLFVYQNHCVIHRLMMIDGNRLVFRGDNCRSCETVERSAVRARLVAIIHSDGSRESCDTRRWRRRSHCVVLRRSSLNALLGIFGRRQRQWERWIYFALLLVLMWAPISGLGIQLNNFVFGIRLDHLLHASVYIPFVFFAMDFGGGRFPRYVPHWLAGLLFAAVTETGQLALFYRGFDPNDLVSNFLGITLGWLAVLILKRKRH